MLQAPWACMLLPGELVEIMRAHLIVMQRSSTDEATARSNAFDLMERALQCRLL